MAVRVALVLLALVVAPTCTLAAETAANPIRKVVTMLQAMVKKVEAEAEKETELYDKFMCYCKTSGGALSKSIADSTAKIPQVESDIKESVAQKAQLEEDIKQHKSDREAAKAAMAEASAIREKEAADFANYKSSADENVDAIAKAVAALEKGMAGFLQTSTASVVKKLALSAPNLLDGERQELLSFLSGEEDSDYAPSSGEIVGILKTMGDEMSKGLAEATAAEEASIKAYEGLMAAKKKEILVLTESIETKMSRVGELGVSIAQMKNDLSDTEQELLEDKDFLADLDKNCATKQAEWEEISKTRAQELVALTETIKILNDDDALELFKKTLPSSSASFVQMTSSAALMRNRALAILQDMNRHAHNHHSRIDFISLALQGKKIGFAKVIKMIDDMVANLKQEQVDDDHKQQYCEEQFDLTDDKKKELEKTISDLETAIVDAKEGIATTATDIENLEDSIKALDKAVAEATENRKEEHEDYLELMSSDSAAKELLKFAKNRLNKFYNPKLYQPPPKRELTDADRAVLAGGGTLETTPAPGGIADTGVVAFADVSLHEHDKVAPPPPPEAFHAYKKMSQENTGVLAMIDLLVQDLDKEMTEAQTSEEDAQAEYEKMMQDSAEQRAMNSKSLTEKESVKASLEGDLQKHKEDKTASSDELAATLSYLSSLHADCDWLLKFFDMRKEARDSEIDALGRAKAVLSGADYSLVQTKAHKFLRH